LFAKDMPVDIRAPAWIGTRTRQKPAQVIDMEGRFGAKAAKPMGAELAVKKELSTDRDKAIAARARQRAIGRELRRMYDEVVQEPIPNDFSELLKKIDQAHDHKKGQD
jgi:hypothetical protein